MEENGWELRWTDFLTVGVPQMDQERKKFIGQVNELNKAVLEIRGKASIRRLITVIDRASFPLTLNCEASFRSLPQRKCYFRPSAARIAFICNSSDGALFFSAILPDP